MENLKQIFSKDDEVMDSLIEKLDLQSFQTDEQMGEIDSSRNKVILAVLSFWHFI